jgi:hypothetical protein
MTPTNSSWKNRLQVIKGDYAEEIIDSYLESKGYVVYNTKTPTAHAFDKVAVKDKQQVMIAECKAKARRNKYADTGINKRHYDQYKFIQDKHKIPVFIFFIDEMLKKIYGNFIELLERRTIIETKQYPCIEATQYGENIIYFPLQNVREVAELSEEQVQYLKENSTRKYEYLT